MIIRPAQLSDCDAIHRFLCDLENVVLEPVRFKAIFRLNLNDPKVHYFVAETSDVLIGFISCHVQYLLHHTGKVGEIQELYVHPNFRNQQIGRQLVQTLESCLSNEGLVNLEVTTNQKRLEAVRFYEKLNFSSTHCKLVKALS